MAKPPDTSEVKNEISSPAVAAISETVIITAAAFPSKKTEHSKSSIEKTGVTLLLRLSKSLYLEINGRGFLSLFLKTDG